MLKSIKKISALIYRGILFPTTRGGWPSISISEHLFATKIWIAFLRETQQFGGYRLYQTFPPLNLPGLRDTSMRLEKYKFSDYVDPGAKILDIGSNMGFISNYLALNGHDVQGVELNPRLVKIACEIKERLNIESSNFASGSFSDWTSEKKYDVILALAVHKWIGLPMPEFAQRVHDLLIDGGVLFFESNNYSRISVEFEKEVAELKSKGLVPVHSDVFEDDCPRKIVVFRKAA